MRTQPIIVERTFDAPIAKVWQALTDVNEMRAWYFDLADFKAVVGFKFDFTGGSDDGPKYKHLCEVTEVIPEKKLTYSWCYDGYPGNSFVTFELSAEGEKTKLTLTHVGMDSFAGNGPDFAVESFTQGWNFIVNESLRKYLEVAGE